MSFNVHGADTIDDPIAGPNMAAQVEAMTPDFVSLQECVECEDFVALLPARYALAGVRGGDSVAYDADRWSPTEEGYIILGSNDDGWGERRAVWVRFEPVIGGGVVDVYSTHWCATIRDTDDPCDVERHLAYGDLILDSIADRGVAAIVGGDFNVFDGFEQSEAVRHLVDGGLVDLLREVSDESVTTFQGNTWAPAGRIDYVFATARVVATAASVDESLDADAGSDHNPVATTFSFE